MTEAEKTQTPPLSETDVLRQRVAALEAQVARQQQHLAVVSQLAAIVASSDNAILSKTLDGIILSWNEGAERLYGYRAEEVIGRSIAVLVPPDRPNELPQILARIAQGERVEQYETVRVRKDGSLISVSLMISPLKDEAGAIIGASAIARDISLQHRAEDQLRTLIQTTQDAVISIDHHGCIDTVNPAAERIFGYTRAEVLGQKVQLLMPEPYASEHDEYVARYQRTGEPHAIGRVRTVAARRKDGEVFPIELSVTEFAVGSEVRYGAFIRDISEKVRLQEQIVEKERLAAIGTTAAKLVHEIGNPLNGMAVATQLLQRRLDKQREGLDERILAHVQSLRGEIGRLARLLQEFRSLSRQQQFAFAPTDLSTVVQEIMTTEMDHYLERGVHVEQQVPHDLPPVQADGDKLKQVVLNLCKNAVEAMPDGGTLTLRLQKTGERLTLEVADTGKGIPVGVNIFEPFVTTKLEGTGLGLPIVRQIVAVHGGSLSYTSAPGRGTTFLVTLPLTSGERKDGTRFR